MFALLAGVSLVAQTVVPSAGVFAATYSQELQDAYNWAYGKSVTTMSSIDNANMYGKITRAELAKMLANWAKSSDKVSNTIDTTKACEFTDTASVKGDLAVAITESCQMGLMGQGITAFRPYDTITRAEFGTALSRALWGNKYEGGTPYYKNHLDALKAAGIMNQIANAESMQEVRGYVMLMLMRVENTDIADQEGNNENTDVVKSGDLSVTATAAAGKKINILWISDLDTLTFKSSEEVTLSKVVLERYGYSANDDVKEVWLEDEDNNVISNVANGLDSKWQAKLTIKKDYKKVDGTYNATIVVRAQWTGGNTMWFKVVSVDSTAKNLNLDNYKPYTYDMVEYAGVDVTFVVRWTTKDYNYEAGNSYEVSKFKVKAPADSAVLVNGFTLTNTGTDLVDVERYLDKVVVKADGKDLKAKYNVNRDKQLVVSFDNVEVAAKKNVEFTVEMSFNSDFEDYGKTIQYAIAKTTDFNAVDAKTESRVKPDLSGITWPVYNFLGGKVKLSNVKVGNVDAAYGAVDIKVAEGSISTTEALRGTFTIYAKASKVVTKDNKLVTPIESMKVTIAGEEYEVSAPTVYEYVAGTDYKKWDIVHSASDITKYYEVSKDGKLLASEKTIPWVPYTFKNVDIEKNGKVEVRVDVRDEVDYNWAKITFSTLNSNAFDTLEYDEVRGKDAKGNVSGFVTVYQLTVQPAKAAFKNNLTKAEEFIKSETKDKTVFSGTYTAKNGTVNLTDWTVQGADPSSKAKVTFYLEIDGQPVDDVKVNSGKVTSSFSDVTVEEWKEVKVVVIAEVEGTTTGSLGTFSIALAGEDENGNPAGNAKANTVELKVVEKSSVSISNDTVKADAVLKQAGAEIASFRVKPSNNASEADLDTIEFTLSGSTDFANFDEYDVTLNIDGTENLEVTTGDTFVTYKATPNTTLDSAGKEVKVTIEKEVSGNVTLEGLKLNDKPQNKTFSKYFVELKVKFTDVDKWETSYVYSVEVEWDTANSVSGFVIYTTTGTNCPSLTDSSLIKTDSKDLSTSDTVEVNRIVDHQQRICGVTYDVVGENSQTVSISRSVYEDYFKIWGKTIDIPKA